MATKTAPIRYTDTMQSVKYIVGIDEVGRGPIAGPLTLGAVMVPLQNRYHSDWNQILDSKKLSPARRQEWARLIRDWQKSDRLQYRTISIPANKIDERGISWCLRYGIQQLLRRLPAESSAMQVLLDGGLRAPGEYRQETIIRGDQSEPVIGLASIIAKVTRDQKMIRYGQDFPAYGFHQHKGYGTKGHYQAIEDNGLLAIHRHTWIRTDG